MRGRLLLLLGIALLPCCRALGRDPWKRILGASWTLVDIEGAPPLEEKQVTLHLEDGSHLFGEGGVNRYFGSFERTGRIGLRIGKIGSTRMAGPPDAMRQEQRFLTLLSKVDAWEYESGQLVLESQGAEILRFVSEP